VADTARVGPSKAARVGLLLILLLIAGTLGTWAWLELRPPPPAKLPDNPDIPGEGFGTAIRLGQAADTVELPARDAPLEVVQLTREALNDRDLYAERLEGKDLLAVITVDDGGPAPWVQELRAYLGPQAESAITLLGQPAATLTPEAVQERLGTPWEFNTETTGRMHLVYYFADTKPGPMAYKLTTSHEYDGRIFAMALAYTLAPQ
jgi:hypothetical protein